ncbi:uncharacterized protein LOC108675284 isoform X3 [Hyalella azteca]|uniref:Uncharacterized protein LOC108675284 isoform X3 n=1 Tax=Hyalella azteca TaxID=294128 RepID=A0A8B7NYF1_HYAAZ|nr:uncharacterized protein LOC108675284 isoform X3 [Hyalella azteca]
MTDYESYQPTTYPWSIVVSAVSSVCIFISFASPYWLANDQRLEQPEFLNLGLWQACFRNYRDYRYFYDRIYDGCYWTLSEEMHVIDDQIRKPFFVAVQTLFTFCFVLTLIGAALTGVLVCCPGEDVEKGLLKLLAVDQTVAGVFGLVAVLVFAALGDSRDWMPHWDNNFLSWAFALAAAGVVLQLLAAVLYWVEYRITKRAEQYRNTHGMFPMETKT